jgi:ubiquinone/menaquinone biosynthesis C-methylase UbiE
MRVVSFDVAGSAYDRFMGRYSRELAPAFTRFARIEPGVRVVDVGCGPGALSEQLAGVVGAEQVGAVDPSEPFVAACRERVPGADVRRGGAEELPFETDSFDAAVAQLVVNFMRDPLAGASEMRRVVRPGGVVSAATWDYGDGMEMLRLFWAAARMLDDAAPDEGRTMRYRTTEELDELWREAGLNEVETGYLTVETTYSGFDDLWEPFTFGVGPAGSYCAALEPARREELRERFREKVGSPTGSFTLGARACAVRGSS